MNNKIKKTLWQALLMATVYALVTGLIHFYNQNFDWVELIISTVVFTLTISLLNYFFAGKKES